MKRLVMVASLFIFSSFGFAFLDDAAAQMTFFKGNGPKVEAEAEKEYYLTDSDGHWFILAKKFSGDDARKNANRLAYELRKRYKVPAWIYKYDPESDDLDELTKKRSGGPVKKYRYLTVQLPEFAVLVGSFPTSDDPALQKTLLTIKRSKPDSLKNDIMGKKMMAEFEFLAKTDKEYAGFGPLGGAIAVPNPLFPQEFFDRKGIVDPLVEKINSDSTYSLLNNPKMYTLRVATFAGNDAYEKDWKEEKARLQDAGIKAAAMCEALRKKGIEAWEFHDRDCSCVTVGSFDSYGRSNPDGTTEMNPEIYRLMENFRGELVGQRGMFKTKAIRIELSPAKAKILGDSKKVRLELPFDLQPVVIMVPQRPGNGAKVIAAKKKLRQEQEQTEIHRLQESMAVDNEEFSRQYGNNIAQKEPDVSDPSLNLPIDEATGLPVGCPIPVPKGSHSMIAGQGLGQIAGQGAGNRSVTAIPPGITTNETANRQATPPSTTGYAQAATGYAQATTGYAQATTGYAQAATAETASTPSPSMATANQPASNVTGQGNRFGSGNAVRSYAPASTPTRTASVPAAPTY